MLNVFGFQLKKSLTCPRRLPSEGELRYVIIRQSRATNRDVFDFLRKLFDFHYLFLTSHFYSQVNSVYMYDVHLIFIYERVLSAIDHVVRVAMYCLSPRTGLHVLCK